MENKDYYKTLGVGRDVTQDELKSAYRKMAMEFHPDRNPDNPEAESKFKEAAEAYDILSSPEKKENYDRFGTSNGNPFSGGGNPFGGSGFGFNMDDIFSQFGNAFGNRYGNKKPQNRGSNLRIKVTLDINEILKGSTKKLKYKRQDKCPDCDGKGGTDPRSCIPCNGTGQRTIVQNGPFGQVRHVSTCPDCGGVGQVITNKCQSCRGEGTKLKEQVVDVDIPVGVSNGMQLSMSGYGNHVRNGTPGDLQIIIEEIRDNSFRRENNNIIVETPISVIDAIIGSNIKVKTPHGELPIAIEPGTQDGKVIRMTGKGIPDINLGLGDLYVKIIVKIPKNITLEEKSILEKLKRSNNFNV